MDNIFPVIFRGILSGDLGLRRIFEPRGFGAVLKFLEGAEGQGWEGEKNDSIPETLWHNLRKSFQRNPQKRKKSAADPVFLELLCGIKLFYFTPGQGRGGGRTINWFTKMEWSWLLIKIMKQIQGWNFWSLSQITSQNSCTWNKDEVSQDKALLYLGCF